MYLNLGTIFLHTKNLIYFIYLLISMYSQFILFSAISLILWEFNTVEYLLDI